MVVNKEGAHNVVDDYSRYIVTTTILFLLYLWHLICCIFVEKASNCLWPQFVDFFKGLNMLVIF